MPECGPWGALTWCATAGCADWPLITMAMQPRVGLRKEKISTMDVYWGQIGRSAKTSMLGATDCCRCGHAHTALDNRLACLHKYLAVAVDQGQCMAKECPRPLSAAVRLAGLQGGRLGSTSGSRLGSGTGELGLGCSLSDPSASVMEERVCSGRKFISIGLIVCENSLAWQAARPPFLLDMRVLLSIIHG